VLHCYETCSLEAYFQSTEQSKVTRGDIRRVRWLGDYRNVLLGEELLHNKRYVVRRVIVTQKQLSLPFLPLPPPNCTAQHLQNLHVEITSNALSRQYELAVHTPPLSKNSGNSLTILRVIYRDIWTTFHHQVQNML
jgi:hypothetical protein